MHLYAASWLLSHFQDQHHILFSRAACLCGKGVNERSCDSVATSKYLAGIQWTICSGCLLRPGSLCLSFFPFPCDGNDEMTQIPIQWHESLTCFHSLTKDIITKSKLMMDDKTSRHLSSQKKNYVSEGRDPIRTDLSVQDSWSVVPICQFQGD